MKSKKVEPKAGPFRGEDPLEGLPIVHRQREQETAEVDAFLAHLRSTVDRRKEAE